MKDKNTMLANAELELKFANDQISQLDDIGLLAGRRNICNTSSAIDRRISTINQTLKKIPKTKSYKVIREKYDEALGTFQEAREKISGLLGVAVEAPVKAKGLGSLSAYIAD